MTTENLKPCPECNRSNGHSITCKTGNRKAAEFQKSLNRTRVKAVNPTPCGKAHRGKVGQCLYCERDEALAKLKKLKSAVNGLDFSFHRTQPEEAMEALTEAMK